ncbi:MAG: ABC transporter permease [Chitinophagaceae bacterium]|nr:ABC transporter permease [Chitinophagaceae bacterium]MCW5926711.1 ABC transporter permease [Chitinophagaceae bacterium]
MFKNYLKIAFRNLAKNKAFSAINIAGLAIGIGCFVLIALYVTDELSFDRFNEKGERTFRISTDIKFGGAETRYPFTSDMMGQIFKKDFPEVEDYTRIYTSNGSKLIKKDNGFINEEKVGHADSTFFNIFTLPAIAGDTKTALDAPNTVVITETAANKYFGTTDAIGEIVETNDNDKTLYKVTAVIKDIPSNAHFNFDFIFSMKNVNYGWGQIISHNFHTYLLLKPGTDVKAFEKRSLDQYVNKYVLPEANQVMGISSMEEFESSGNKLAYSLTPMLDIHLYSGRPFELRAGGNIQYVYIFSLVAVFILLIACINFMNLTTARSANRAKEVGIRKVLGTDKKDLITQFLSESTVMAIISTLLGIGMVLLALPLFNSVAGKSMQISNLFTPVFGLFLLALPFVVGLMAGSYPAFFLSSFKPILVLKGKLKMGGANSGLRSTLVVFQFVTSIVLIIGTIVIYRQLNYIQSKNPGYTKEQVLIINDAYTLGRNAETFKQEMLQQPGVVNGTLSGYLPTPSGRSDNLFSTTPQPDVKNGFSMQEWSVDHDYIHALGMELVSGRNFSKDHGTDSSAVILNETTAKSLGYDDPIGKSFYSMYNPETNEARKYTIIGVVKDFHFESMKRDIGKLGLFLRRSTGLASFRVDAANAPRVIQAAEQKWKAMSPQMPFNYRFLDADFNRVYDAEQRVGRIALSFAVLAILIACLGLFGLAAYIAEQRTKEIGIRKVLGASATSLVAMLSKDFLKLVLISSVIAFPLAWWSMRTWLQDFAYRIDIGWWVFVAAGVIVILIALITISFQAIKAALANPVVALRSE